MSIDQTRNTISQDGIDTRLRPAVSVIIVNLNTCNLLRVALVSVFEQKVDGGVEVLVIDNGSIDGSSEMVRENFPAVHLQVNSANEGFAKPTNDGMKGASGRYLFLLNSDTVVRPGALATLVRFLDEHAEAGACAPRLVYPDGRQQYSVKGLPTIWTHLADMLFLDKLFPRSKLFGREAMRYFPYDRTEPVDYIAAAAFLVRREMITDVGMLDERFPIYHNDTDWCRRIRQHGWKIYYVHDAVVAHHMGETVGRINRDFSYFQVLYDNVVFYYQKHYGKSTVVIYKLLLVLGFSVRAVGWQIVRWIRPSEHAAMMATFSWKSLAYGLQFWKMARQASVKNISELSR